MNRQDRLSSSQKDLLAKILSGKSDMFKEKRIRRYSREGSLSASFAQKRLWFLDQLTPNSAAYNVTYFIRLKGSLHMEAMKRSVQALIDRHEGLRTTFAQKDDQPFQVICDSLLLDMPCTDLTSYPPEEREKRAWSFLEEAGAVPVDLENEPLIRVQFICLSEEDHFMFINVHHIVFDGWSAGVFFKELTTLYEGFVNEVEVKLPDLLLQYADYAIWHQEQLQAGAWEGQLNYWKHQLAGELPVLNLPYDRPRPTHQTYRGAVLHFSLSDTLYRGLKELSRQEEVSLYMTLLAAFQTLMHRYTHQDDILVAAPIANRSRTEWEGVVGFFANTILLRTDFSGQPSFRELLQRVRQVTLDAYSNQDIPFEKLVEELTPHRDLSMNPMFQIMFNHFESPEDTTFAGLETEFIDLDNGTTKFDFEVQVVEKLGGLHGRVEYSTDLFDRQTLERMVKHYQALLESILLDPARPVTEYNLLSGEERHLLLAEWNATEADFSEHQCLQELFEEQAAQTPDEIAVVYNGQSWTYGELNCRANGLAAQLRRLGVGPEIRVGVCLHRSPEMVMTVLGILKSGGAYISLDPYDQSDRLRHIAEDARLSMIVTSQGMEGYMPVLDIPVIYLEHLRDSLVLSDENVRGGNPEDMIYIVYTSGTTGKPKGIAMTHRPLVNLLTWQKRQWVHGPKARSLQFSSLGFDMSCFEFFTTFGTGSTLVIPTEEERSDPERLIGLLKEQEVERAYFPYVALQQLAELALETDTSGLKLKELLVAGEQLRITPDIRAFLKRLDDCVLHNHYGPSEAHVVTTYPVFINREEHVLAPIGRPIANTQIYILDRLLQPVPIGVPGEIYVAGVCLARGYFHLPEMTEERFVANPFSSEMNARMYKTGDVARYLPDGNIQYLGRADSQIKIRGYRVELGEIEAVLQHAPGLSKVAVAAREEAPGRIELAAYYAAREVFDGEALRTYLQGKLPDYMIPAFYIQLDEFPLTSGGKINYRALPEPDRQMRLSSGGDKPSNRFEKELASIWEEVLGCAEVGRDSHFFSLGGHSLVATRVISRARNVFQADVPLRLIFEAPVLKDMAERIRQVAAEAPSEEAGSIRRYSRGEPIPASYAESRLWFLDQLDPGQASYNMPYALRCRGELDLAGMKRSVQAMIDRHEGLRTVFVSRDDELYKVIADKLEPDMPCVNLTEVKDCELEVKAKQLLEAESRAPFDLHKGPLLRLLFIRLREDDYLLLFHFHHIILDGWSAGVFFKELAALYEGEMTGRDARLPELPLQYADYSLWQRDWLERDVLKRQLAYWQECLAGELPMLELPYDKQRPAHPTFMGEVVEFALSSSVSRKLKELGRQQNASLYMTLLASFKAFLYRYTRQEDIMVAVPVANRSREEWEGVIGFFANTILLRTDLSGGPTFRQLLWRVRQATLDAYSNQDVPFEKLVEKLMPTREAGMNPMFQVMFNYVESSYETPLYGMQTEYVDVNNNTAKFDLEWQMMEREDGVYGRIEYSTDLFEKATIERMVSHYLLLVEQLARNPEGLLSEVPMLGESERHRLLYEWNATEADYPDDKCLHELFEEQAALCPDQIAVRYNGLSMTYGELNRRSNGLAYYLRRLGVGADDRIGMYLHRSLDMIVTVLGILKAGAAYVPLDPNDRSERVVHILEDAKPLLVLTTKEMEPDDFTLSVKQICLDLIMDELPLIDENTRSCCPDNLMYLIYTSGSTGKPKGVALNHRPVVNLIAWQGKHWVHEAKACTLQFASLSFDMSCMEMFMSFATGSTLVVPTEEERSDPVLLLDLLAREEVERCYFPYAALQQLAEVYSQFPVLGLKVRELIAAGEQLRITPQIAALLGSLDNAVLHNHYGPSETHVVTTYPVFAGREQRALPPIGRPIDNTRIYILDDHLEPVPIGVPGDMYIAGICLARGYFNSPKQTAEKFVADPFGRQGQARMYKTGDIARYLPNGNIQYLGRGDNQIKIRGYRVEPGEIESVLQQVPGIVEAAVVSKTAADRTELAAYYTANGEVTLEQLRESLQSKLPGYMVPVFYTRLDVMPLTGSGKIDRKALPEPDYGLSHTSEEKPATSMEKQLALIWENMLGCAYVGRDSDFFHLGGHSLIATRVASQIRNTFHIDVPIRLLFEAPVLKDLAALLDERAAGVKKVPVKMIQTQPRTGMKRPSLNK